MLTRAKAEASARVNHAHAGATAETLPSILDNMDKSSLPESRKRRTTIFGFTQSF
jgi:hypothetical protein